MNDEVLEQAVRGHTAADVGHAVEVLTRTGFSIGIQLMLGLPGESTVSFLRSVEAVIGLEPDFVRLYPVLVLKNTELATLYEEGEFTPLHLNQAITLIRKARSRFTQNNIDVIRIGLQPSAELEENVIAGPYHPSLGACVMSRDFYLRARNIMERSRAGAEVVITLCDRDYSAFVGMRRSNIKRLEQRFPDRKLSVMIDPTIKRGEVRHAFC